MPNILRSDSIFIEGLRVPARVGIYPRESAPQWLSLDIEFGLPGEANTMTQLTQTIDYAAVINAVRHALSERHFDLLENMGQFISDLLLQHFSAPWVKISIVKIGVMQDVARVGIRIERPAKGGPQKNRRNISAGKTFIR